MRHAGVQASAGPGGSTPGPSGSSYSQELPGEPQDSHYGARPVCVHSGIDVCSGRRGWWEPRCPERRKAPRILDKNAELASCTHTGTRCAGAPLGTGAVNPSLFCTQGNRGPEKPHRVMVDKWQSRDLNAVALTPEPRDLCVRLGVFVAEKGAGRHDSQRTGLSAHPGLFPRGRHVAQQMGPTRHEWYRQSCWAKAGDAKPAPLPGCIPPPPALAATLEKGQALEASGGPSGG